MLKNKEEFLTVLFSKKKLLFRYDFLTGRADMSSYYLYYYWYETIRNYLVINFGLRAGKSG